MNTTFSREQVREIRCPKCGAAVGRPCRERGRDRQANHLERHTLYARLRDPVERRILEEGEAPIERRRVAT